MRTNEQLHCLQEHPAKLSYRPTKRSICFAIKEGSHYTVYGTQDTVIAKLNYFGDGVGIYHPSYLCSPTNEDIESISYFMNRLNSNLLFGLSLRNYVYMAVVDGTIKYIGKGDTLRWKHCISGVSHVKMLNRDFFSGRKIDVYIIKAGMTNEDALKLESELIANFSSHYGEDFLYNTQGIRAKRPTTYISEEALIVSSQLVGTHREVI